MDLAEEVEARQRPEKTWHASKEAEGTDLLGFSLRAASRTRTNCWGTPYANWWVWWRVSRGGSWRRGWRHRGAKSGVPPAAAIRRDVSGAVPGVRRSTPFYAAETPPPPGGGPGPGPVDGVGEQSAPAGPAGDGGMGRGGAGGAPTAGSCDDGGLWLYHGSDTAIDSFKVDDAIARQQSRPWRRLENGEGIYFTDDALRAAEYSSNKVAGGVYRGWAPQDLLDRLAAAGKISRISTNNSLQYVINSQVDAEVLNQTFGRARAVDVILNGGWPESGTGC